MMQNQLWHSVYPTLDSKIIAYVEDNYGRIITTYLEDHSRITTKADRDRYLSKGRTLATEFRDVYLHSVQARKNIRPTLMDRLMVNIETRTGGTWNWWPLRPPLRGSGDDCV